jgi:hypothetical protein
MQTSGGGSDHPFFVQLRTPPVGTMLRGFGAAAPATPKVLTNNDLTQDIAPQFTEAGGFDIMQFISDNALWLGLGLAGVVAIMLLSKKGRR